MAMKYLIRVWASLSLLPIVNAFSVVATYGVNRPYVEEFFSTALIAIAAHDGTLTFSQLLEPVNEHPYFFTKLVLALHTNLTRFDLRVDMFLSVVMNTAIFLILCWWLWKQNRRLALVAAPLLSLLVLTPAQAINWLVAFQNIFFISVLFLVLLLSVIVHLPVSWRAILYAMILALAGSFSMGIAPALWSAPLPALWLRGYRHWRYYALWLALAVSVNLYFISMMKPLTPPLPPERFGWLVGTFAPAYLGSSLTAREFSIVVGVVGVALLVFNSILLWWKRPEWLSSWAGLAIFSILTSLMAGYGRWPFFAVDSPDIPSRYVTQSVMLWCALLAICASNFLAWHRETWQNGRVLLKLIRSQALSVALIIRPRALEVSIRSVFSFLNIISLVFLSVLYLVRDSHIPDFRGSLPCFLEFPSAWKPECINPIANSHNTAPSPIVRVYQLAARQLGPFAYYPPAKITNQSISLPMQEMAFGCPTENFRQEVIEGRTQSVFFQHPPSICQWTLWFQYISVPAYFESEIYILPSKNPERLPVDGVTFRVHAQVETERLLLFEQHFDPNRREPMPVRVSLDQFSNRLAWLNIFLETDAGEMGNSYYDWAVWIEPRIVLELSEEAARATYYPPR